MFRYYVCRKCGKKYYPKKLRCKCGSMNFEEVVKENAEGVILTYTIIYVPPKGFVPPIYVAIVEVDGMKVLGRYEGELEGLKIGAKVSVELKDGIAFFLPR